MPGPIDRLIFTKDEHLSTITQSPEDITTPASVAAVPQHSTCASQLQAQTHRATQIEQAYGLRWNYNPLFLINASRELVCHMAQQRSHQASASVNGVQRPFSTKRRAGTPDVTILWRPPPT